MKLWKVAVVVEIPVFARTKEAAIDEALKVPWSDLEHQPITAKVIRQITHVKHLPSKYTLDDLVWIADDSMNLIEPSMATPDAALLVQAEIKTGLRHDSKATTDSE
jgi:hypothetical protein